MKTNQDQQRIAAAFERLFRTYGPLGQGSTPEEITRDRIERIRVYFDAVAPYDEADVEAAVEAFLNGSAPGVNPNFAPPAPAVGSETRRQMNLRLDSEAREKARRPKLPPPDIERDAESRARVRELVANTVANLTEGSLKAETNANRLAMQRRTNERFDGERGFTVGDPDGDEAAA